METSARLFFDGHGELLHKYMRECLVVAKNFDLVLVCADGHVSAHRCLLALASPFLGRLLSELECEMPEVVTVALDDTPSKDAVNLLELLYTGSTSVSDKELRGLMKLTKVLKLKPMPVSVTTYAIIKTFTQQVNEVSNAIEDKEEVASKEFDVVGENSVHDYPEEDITVQFENADPPDEQNEEDLNVPIEKQSCRGRTLGDQGVRNVVKIEVTEEFVEKVASKMVPPNNVLSEEDHSSIKFENNVRNAVTDIKLCYICEAKIRGYNGFLQHLRLHEAKNGPYPCPWRDCHASNSVGFLGFQTGLTLHRHIGEHLVGCEPVQGRKAPAWKCSHTECDEEFTTKSALMHHKKVSHKIKTVEDYVCNEINCDASFSGFKPFKMHMQEVHKKRPLQCSECDQRFNDKASMRVHVEAKHGTGRNFTCDVCGKKFSAARFMMHHRREQHEEGEKRRIKCDLCDFVSLGVRNLRKHVKIMHNENLPVFKCSYCTHTSKSKGNIVAHEKIHTEECPFKCEICQKTFRRNTHLRNHRNKCHTSRPKEPVKNLGSINETQPEIEDSMKVQEVEEMPAEYSIIEGNAEQEGRIIFFPAQQIVAHYC